MPSSVCTSKGKAGQQLEVPPEVDVPQRQCCCELQEQEEHTRAVPVCMSLSPPGTLQGTGVILMEEPC